LNSPSYKARQNGGVYVYIGLIVGLIIGANAGLIFSQLLTFASIEEEEKKRRDVIFKQNCSKNR
jgi:hypothetical protein